MQLNGSALNSTTLNASNFPIISSGALISFEQDVRLRITGSGSLIDVEQEVKTLASGSLISIAQKISSVEESTFFSRNGWALSITLDGFNVPADTIQDVTVVHGIADDSRATVKLNPGAASYNLYSYQGKDLSISVRTGDTFERIFSGVVDIPRVEVVNEKIILEGVSSRETLIRNSLTPYVASIGSYSETVFGAKNNVFQETNARMSTIPYDLDFDANNNWYLTSWTPKASPDITLGNSDLYREQQPEVRIESAREIVNKVSISFTYGYQRLHQAGLSYTWNSGLQACDFLTLGNTLPNRNMIRTAASGTGWLLDNIGYTNLWASGFYHCSGNTIGWVNTRQDVIISNTGLVDPSGNNYTQSQVVGLSEIDALLALGASWTVKRRFTQNVKETYSLTVNSPQSQALYGIREKNDTIALDDPFDASQWEDIRLYDSEFSGTKYSANSTTYYINKDTQGSERIMATTTALNKAKTDILRSHRDTEVSYNTFINPSVQLHHTVYLNTTRINAKGKVRGITHSFNTDGEATTSVRLALYRSVGSQAESALSAPNRPTFSNPTVMASVSLGSRWGQDPSQTIAATWTGYVGNKWVIENRGFNVNTYKTSYQESFIVDAPAIPDDKRNEHSYSISASYNVSIPTDTLTITFVDS